MDFASILVLELSTLIDVIWDSIRDTHSFDCCIYFLETGVYGCCHSTEPTTTTQQICVFTRD